MSPLASMFLLLGLILGAVVLARVLSAASWQITKKPSVRITSEWMTDQATHDRLASAPDPFHYKPMSDKAAKGFKKSNQRIVP